MAGIHADRGDHSHRIISGETPVIGLRVLDNDIRWGVIETLGDMSKDCGWYCDAWATTRRDDGSTGFVNCERMTTRDFR